MLLAIDIGSRHIHMVEGEYKSKRFKISRHITEPTPEGALMDGEINNIEEITSKLRTMIQKYKIHTKQVVFTVNPGSMVSRKFIIPNVKKAETLPILQNEMNGLMNFPEPHVVDFTDIDKNEDGTFSIDTVALSKEIIKQYWDMAKSLKLIPVALDIHQNAVYKFILSSSDIDYRNLIVADIGNTYMNTYLFRDSTRVFARRMLINTEQYERTLVSLGKLKTVGVDFARLDLSPEALSKDAVLDNTISLYLSNIVDQLQRVMQFHMSMGTKGQMSPVSHIYLCGAMANMRGLTEYIQSYMDVEVGIITDIVSPRVCKVDRLPQYVNAVGALVRLD
ncbi:MAG: pilus assembly protein PilM [Cellulosilyticaceae bacterium]